MVAFAVRLRQLLQFGEIVGGDRIAAFQRADRHGHRHAAALLAGIFGEDEGARDLVPAIAVGALEETVAPIVAAEFAIGDRLQPDALLQRDGVADGRILDRAQRRGGDFPGLTIAPRLQQRSGPQHAADVIGMEGWIEMSFGHRCLPCFGAA